MDIDRYLVRNQETWDRLAALTTRAQRGLRHLDAAEIDELVRLYQRVSTHLSYTRTYFADPALVARLTGLVAAAGGVIYGSRPRTWRRAGRFFTDTFPAAVWYARRFVAVSAALLLVPALAMGLWLARSPRAVEATAPEAVREAYLTEDFEAYYSSQPAIQFTSEVATNNVRVSILAFAGGIAFCLLTAILLIFNGASIGIAGGLFASAGESGRFFGLVLPHGLLELSAVIVAGAAGLQLGWALIAPGDRRRSVALVEEARRAVVIVIGLVLVFVVAAVVEGFVTGRPWPTTVRVGIGLAVWLAFTGYVLVRGRRPPAPLEL